MTKLELIEKYLTSFVVSEDNDPLFSNYNHVMWIDNGEKDEDIISYCRVALSIDNLLYATENADNKQGFIAYIEYQGNRNIIPYKGEGADRDTTIITLNEVLKPTYEIRFCREFDISDTLAFLPLKMEEWLYLENKYPTATNCFFGKIKPNDCFFNVEMDEMMERYNLFEEEKERLESE